MSKNLNKVTRKNNSKLKQGYLCCVPGCHSFSLKDKNVGFYPFPKSQRLKSKWIERIQETTNESFKFSPEQKICGLHFNRSGTRKFREDSLPRFFKDKTYPRKGLPKVPVQNPTEIFVKSEFGENENQNIIENENFEKVETLGGFVFPIKKELPDDASDVDPLSFNSDKDLGSFVECLINDNEENTSDIFSNLPQNIKTETPDMPTNISKAVSLHDHSYSSRSLDYQESLRSELTQKKLILTMDSPENETSFQSLSNQLMDKEETIDILKHLTLKLTRQFKAVDDSKSKEIMHLNTELSAKKLQICELRTDLQNTMDVSKKVESENSLLLMSNKKLSKIQQTKNNTIGRLEKAKEKLEAKMKILDAKNKIIENEKKLVEIELHSVREEKEKIEEDFKMLIDKVSSDALNHECIKMYDNTL